MPFLNNLLDLTLEAAPWLILGLMVAGIIKAWMNENWLSKHLGGNGFGSVVKAAFIGTPLPLCSCSVIPVAMGIRRSGASKSSTVSFLVATPETGADSIALSYALLGPLMAIVRPIAAIFSAITSGMLVAVLDQNEVAKEGSDTKNAECCSKKSCCDSQEMSPSGKATLSHWARISGGLKFAFTDIFDDFIKWLAIGLLFAALVQTFVPHSFLAEWGSGLLAMFIMMLVGIPMYICATASTPIAAALILAGVSPGTALVFLLAGPATNMATLAVINQELGKRSLILYLAGMGGASILSGLALDSVLSSFGINITSQLSSAEDIVPLWLTWGSFAALIVFTLMAMRRRFLV